MAVNVSSPPAPGRSFLHWLAAALWRLLVASVLLLAIYVAAGRALMGNVAGLQQELLAALNERLPFTLAADAVEGRMDAFSPELVFTDLRLSFPGEAIEPLQLARGSLRLAPLRSLLTRSPQASVVTLRGLSLELERDLGGALKLRGFDALAADGRLRRWLAAFLPRVRALTLEDNRVLLRRRDAPGRRARVDMTLQRSGSERTLDATLVSAAGNRVTLHAEGLGDPLAVASWRGDVFLGLEAAALDRVFDWLPPSVPVRAAGTGRARLWLQRAGGRSSLRLALAGEALTLSARGGSWSVPLESLAMNAALAEQEQGWDLHASELALAQAGRRWLLPRARFASRGAALRVRTGAFRLDGIDGFLASLPAVPRPLADALQVLAPRGAVRALDLSFDDLGAPAAGWDLTARVDELAVDSWRGAPGARGASAFVHLYPGGGDVRLDSEDIALLFPKVYRQPLAYDALHGDLRLRWDRSGLAIRSGLLTASGPEGTARGLLSLSVPFMRTETGPVMELLVGLRDSDARYRGKYLPYRLPGSLRDWLLRSIVAGDLRRGGFVWRGSLRQGNAEHLTVQLAADVRDARLAFDPRWPPLDGFSGRLLVDDTRVSVWGEGGTLSGARLRALSAETWFDDDGGVLAVTGSLAGDAAQGLALINGSPLAAQSGALTADWRAAGPTESDIDLLLPLDGGPPRADVRVRVDRGSLTVPTVGLAFTDLRGEVRYHWRRGFSSGDIAARLWDAAALTVRLQQADAGAPLRIGFSSASLPLAALEGRFGAGWTLPARGAAGVSGELTLAGDAPPTLALRSDLAGVEVRLPPPWGKASSTSRRLALALEPRAGGDGLRLTLALGQRLVGELSIDDGRLRRGRLRLEADWLQGALDFRGSTPHLLLDWLALDRLPQGEEPLAFDPLHRLLRPMEVTVLEVRRAGDRVGEFALGIDRDDDALYLRDIRGELFGLRSAGDDGGVLRWAGGTPATTALTMDLAFDDIGAVFESLGYAPALVSDRGWAQADLGWSGSPLDAALATATGSLTVTARDGRVLAASGSTGALKMVTFLNLAEILRGLSLAQMVEAGIPFERATGEFRFRNGRVEIPALTLRGAASAFEFSGHSDLERIDGELVVTLPVAGNLPWVAALAGGIPVAAGVYVVSKVFEKQVKRMSSGVYEVSGPLGDPALSLRRIFDDSANAPDDPAPAPPGDTGDDPAEAEDPPAAAGAAPSGP